MAILVHPTAQFILGIYMGVTDTPPPPGYGPIVLLYNCVLLKWHVRPVFGERHKH